MKNIIILFLSIILPFTFYAQENTVIIDYSERQGAFQDCGLSSCIYFESIGDQVSYNDGTGGQSDTKNARYLFEHPGFNNDKIKKIILEIRINKIFQSTGLDAGMSIRSPNNSCNSTIPWSGFINEEDLYYCNQNGTSIFQDGIGTGNTSPTTFNLLIYDESSSGFIGQTLSNFDPNSDSFTFSFHPFVGGVKVHSAKVHITYEDTSGSNELPETPSLTASSNSTSSINLNWNSITNATSYQVFDCNNQQVTTTTSNSYTVTGLNSGRTYGYKVKAINNNGASSFSNCSYATTTASNGGGCSSLSSVTPSTPFVYTIGSRVLLAWNTIPQANAYRIYRCGTNEYLGETTESYIDIETTDLIPGESITYKIEAVDYCNNGGAYLSQLSSCSSPYNVPCLGAIPEDLRYTSQVNLQIIAVNWTDTGHGGDWRYEIFDCTTNEILYTTTRYRTDYIFTYEPGVSYSLKVRSVGCYPSDFSECINIVAPGCLENLLINNESINSSEIYEVTNSIEVSESTFEPNSTTIVQAGNTISILPNTHFKYGSEVNLKIGECSTINELNRNITYKNEENIFKEIKTIENNALSNILYEYKFKLPTNDFNILVYPNPSDDYLNIKITKKLLGGKLTLYNLSNQILWKKDKVNTESEIINVKQLPSGLYFLKATMRNKTTVLKVIKK